MLHFTGKWHLWFQSDYPHQSRSLPVRCTNLKHFLNSFIQYRRDWRFLKKGFSEVFPRPGSHLCQRPVKFPALCCPASPGSSCSSSGIRLPAGSRAVPRTHSSRLFMKVHVRRLNFLGKQGSPGLKTSEHLHAGILQVLACYLQDYAPD